MMAIMQIEETSVAIPGLTIRNFQGEQDFPRMFSILSASKRADRADSTETLEELTRSYQHLTNCDVYRDVLIAEVDGEPAAYSRVAWHQENANGNRIYTCFGFINPEWRRKGLGSLMLKMNEARLRQIASEHPLDGARYFESFAEENQTGSHELLKKAGYTIERLFYKMVRPDLENIPEIPIPVGLEIRPAAKDQFRQIWGASVEAFRDHWGFSEPTEEDYQDWISWPYFQPEFWQVAWDGDQVAGMVLNFIDYGENEKFNRKRGYTENICVRRPYRGKGLARALIASSLKVHKAQGMEETALFVDTANLSGALHLYESMGYQPVQVNTTYRKPLD